MKAFVVSVNGIRLRTIGVVDGVLTAHVVSSVGGTPFLLQLGGLEKSTDEHVVWNVPDLNLGDEVTIKIVDVPTVDPESYRHKAKP